MHTPVSGKTHRVQDEGKAGRCGRELYPACFKDVFKAVKFLVQPRQAQLYTGPYFKVRAGVFVLLLNEG